MKVIARMVVVGIVSMSLAVFAGSYVPSDIAWLKTSMDSGNPTSWPGAGGWQLDDADEPLDSEENSSQDYGVKDKKHLRPKIGTATFAGKSLTLGATDCSSSGAIIFRTSGGCDTTFDNEGLFLYRGMVQGWNSGTQIVRGKVTVRSPASAPVEVCFTTRGGELVLRCPVESDDDAGLYLHSLVASSSTMNQTNFVCRFLDDALANYAGSIVCCPVAHERKDTKSWYVKDNYNATLRPPYHVTFQTDSGTMPGSLTLYPNAIIAGESSNTVFSVGSLSSVSLDGFGTNFLSVAMAEDGSTCSVIRVTGTLNLQSPMAVRLSPDNALDIFAATNAAAAMRLPVFKAPSGVTLDPDMFFMERGDSAAYLPHYRLEVSSDEADGLSTLWLVRLPVAWSKGSDGFKQSSFLSARASNWSDNDVPTLEKDNLAIHNLRTPHTSSTTMQTFPGNSLSLVNSMLSLNSPCAYVGQLRVFRGTIDNLNEGNATYNFMDGILNKSWVFDGHIRISPNGSLSLRCYPSKGLRVDSEISGGGTIEIQNYTQSGYGNSPHRAYVGIFGMNTNFYGSIIVSNRISTTLANRLGSNIAIRDARNLGGPCPSWTFNALVLNKCSGLHPLESLTLDDDTRGIYIPDEYAFFTVTNDVVFTCKERITYNGILIKDGTGELALGGPQPYFTSDGNTTPASGKNVLDVWDGTLRPVSAAAFQGLAVVITNGATLAFDVPASNTDGDIGQYGMLNIAWDEPLTVPEGGLTVELRDSNCNLDGKRLWRVPVCTVNATAYGNLRTKLSVGRSPSRRHVVAGGEWTENTDGSFTFAAVLERTGFTIIFR